MWSGLLSGLLQTVNVTACCSWALCVYYVSARLVIMSVRGMSMLTFVINHIKGLYLKK